MINAEKKFEQLRQGLNNMKTEELHSRIENRLHSAWKVAKMDAEGAQEVSPETRTKKWGWNILTYALGISGLAVLAVFSTVAIEPASPTSTTQTQTKKHELSFNGDVSGQSMGSSVSGNSPSSLGLEDIEFEEIVSVENNLDSDTYTYDNQGQPAELLNESVILSIDVKGEVLDTIQKLRTQVSSQQGYLLDISYHDNYGTFDIKLPADQLDSFEQALKELDRNKKIEVTDYVVENISEQIVTLDENIRLTQEQIDANKAQLASGNLTESQRADLQEQIIANEESVKELNAARQEKIAEFSLISVRVIINKYTPFWQGDYYQYDRTTISGMVKYELARAIYYLVKSGSKVLRFLVWLAVYSVVFIPAFIIIRKVVRSIMNKIKHRKSRQN